MRTPNFWNRKGILSTCLTPVSWVIELVGECRQKLVIPEVFPVPLICVGNLVVGGAGKTPVALDIGTRLQAMGIRSCFLSRGYKGRMEGPVKVDEDLHSYKDVGDEPLLLSRCAPCFVSTDRPAGAQEAIADGAQIIIMDDGFQNCSIQKTLSLVVVDGRNGFGNHRLIPAGPLREPIEKGIMRADAVISIGPPHLEMDINKPILRAKIQSIRGNGLEGKRVIAFAGIGRPEKFFRSLRETGAKVVSSHSFPDHHPYKVREITAILNKKIHEDDIVVTTEKDMVRVPLSAAESITAIPAEVKWEEEGLIEDLLQTVI